MYKTCNKCTNHLHINKFHKLKKGLLGCHPTCKRCRGLLRERKNITVSLNCKVCNLCKKNVQSINFYKNKNSNDGLQSYCKECHKKKISQANSKLEKFCKLVLNKFKKKNKSKEIKITFRDIMNKYEEQDKKCIITNHIMTHKCDIKQRTDNIWNLSIYINKEIREVNYSNFSLVSNLIYSVKEIYNLNNEEILNIYSNLK